MTSQTSLLALVLFAIGCGGATDSIDAAHGDDAGDAGPRDATVDDAGIDAGPRDATVDDAGPPSGPLGLSDVSTLFPLPATLASSPLLRLDAEGVGGSLLSRAQFDALMAFDADPAGETTYDAFRIVAARIDPCFPSLPLLDTDPASCRPQMRLVAQPLYQGPGATARARDSAIHLLYELTTSELDAMVSELVVIRGDRAFDPAETLGVHPVLAVEGDDGPYGEALRAWILAHAGVSRLDEVTFVRGDGNFSWLFGGFVAASDGTLTRFDVADVDREGGVAPTIQRVGLDPGLSGPDGDRTGVSSVSPQGAVSRSIAALFGVRRTSMGMPYWEYENAAAVESAIAAAYAVENPYERNTFTADCASCHLAGAGRARAQSHGYEGDRARELHSVWNLTRTVSPELAVRPNVVRAFGYFDDQPVVSQRTINESAAVAERLDATL